MSCVLRAAGRDFDIDSFLNSSALKALVVYHRGEQQFPDAPIHLMEQSGMNISVSEREFSNLAGQIEDATRFLSENASELERLRAFPGVERLELDFPIVDRDAPVQTDLFPADLLLRMGNLKIALRVSRYPESS